MPPLRHLIWRSAHQRIRPAAEPATTGPCTVRISDRFAGTLLSADPAAPLAMPGGTSIGPAPSAACLDSAVAVDAGAAVHRRCHEFARSTGAPGSGLATCVNPRNTHSKQSNAASHAFAKPPKSVCNGCDSTLYPEHVQAPDLRLHRDRAGLGDKATPNRSAFYAHHRTAAHGLGEALHRAQ